MNQIKPYILEKCPGFFDFYRYLHIRGGAGNWKGKKEENLLGGEYTYLLFYARPDEMEGLDKCERIWCKEKEIIFGTGYTIEEAYQNYLQKAKDFETEEQLKDILP